MLGLSDNSWRKDILTHIKRADTTLRSLAAGKKWDFIINLLDEYNETVAKAMGSLSARGGYPYIEFRGHTAEGYWPALSPFTIAYKNGHDLFGAEQEDIKNVYDAYADSTHIWSYTNHAEQSLTINIRQGRAGLFGDAAEYAQVVEEGGEGSWQTKSGPARIPSRPLFSVVNALFYEYISDQISKRGPLYYEIRRELLKAGNWRKG